MTPKRVLVLMLKIILLIMAGIAVAAALLFYAAVGPFAWIPSVRWWSLAGTTVLVFWAVVKQFRRHWQRVSFWVEVGGLLGIHLFAYTILLLRVPEWRLLWFVPVSVVEGGLLVLVLAKVAGRAL